MRNLWTAEQRLWTDGVEAYEDLMAKDCTMVFGPMGIMKRSDVIESLRGAPRWSKIIMSAETENIYSQSAVVLAYHALAEQEDGTQYEAVCTSTYVRDDGRWRIAQHQQTPI
jgi:hypothetical protein